MAGLIQRYFAGLSRNTFLLAATSLFADISTEMLYPVLPVFLTQTLKASGSIVGLVDGFAQATQNIVQGFSGALSDRLRRRKPVAVAGYLLAAIAKPLMGIATIWQVLFGARLLDRLGAGARSAPRDALIAASVDEENRGRAFGLEGVGDNAGAFLGPLLTAFLLYELHVGIRQQQRLRVGVDRDELDALQPRVDHAVDGVAAAAADTDDLDHCQIVLRCAEHARPSSCSRVASCLAWADGRRPRGIGLKARWRRDRLPCRDSPRTLKLHLRLTITLTITSTCASRREFTRARPANQSWDTGRCGVDTSM